MGDMTPKIGEADWTPYVLSQLRDDERSNGYPRVEGLRRLAREYVGDFDDPIYTILQYPTILQSGIKSKVNSDKAVFVYQPAIVQCDLIISTISLPVTKKKFSHMAEASMDNIESFAIVFPLAMARARAESGCLRKALQLNNVYTNEEYSEKLKNITDSQISVMQFLCQKQGQDLNKFLTVETNKAFSFKNIRDIPSQMAADLLSKLTQKKPVAV